MITKMFAIYDSAALAYNAPFSFGQMGQAVRAFADLASDPNSNISKHPQDYVLFMIGQYNDNTGVMEPMEHVRLGKPGEWIDDPQVEVTDLGKAALEEAAE